MLFFELTNNEDIATSKLVVGISKIISGWLAIHKSKGCAIASDSSIQRS